LVGNTPGWPATDLRIINDNNKAQRNMGLSTTPATGAGNGPSFCALVHNGAPYVRNMTLRCDAPDTVSNRLGAAQVEVVGGMSVPLKSGLKFTLPKMQPGENRWVCLSFSAPQGQAEEVVAVNFYEVVDNKDVNGFAIGCRLAAPAQVARDNLELHRSVFTRVLALANLNEAQREIDEAGKLLAGKEIPVESYSKFIAARLKTLSQVTTKLLGAQQGTDSFALAAAVKSLNGELAARDANRLFGPHTALLNKLDAYLTMQQLTQGDPADILQNVRWQVKLYSKVPQLNKLQVSGLITGRSQNFIAAYGVRKSTNKDYPALIKDLLTSFTETAKALAGPLADLDKDVQAMQGNLGSLAALQKAHRDYLLKLQTLVPPGP